MRLVQETESTAHEFGSPGKRREVQQLLDAHEHFVLYVKTSKEQLGWLSSQALLAEDIYTESLRSQLLEWGWKPQSILTSDEVVAQLARQHIQDDPSEVEQRENSTAAPTPARHSRGWHRVAP